MEPTQICTRCHQEKGLDGFSYDSHWQKHRARCKVCERDLKREYRAAHPDREKAAFRKYNAIHRLEVRARQRERRDNPSERAKAVERSRLWRREHRDRYNQDASLYRETNPEKWDAHQLVKMAMGYGILVPQPCANCGAIKVVAHHPDYTRPLEVIWLCPKCHRRLHADLRACYELAVASIG